MTTAAERVPARKKACPKCKAAMIVQRLRDVAALEESRDGLLWKCLACGKEEPFAMVDPSPAPPRIHPSWGVKDTSAPPSTAAIATIDPLNTAPAWTDTALERLGSLIAAVARIHELQAEAERTHAALAAFGVNNLPALPWRTARVPSKTHPGRLPGYTAPTDRPLPQRFHRPHRLPLPARPDHGHVPRPPGL